MPRAARKKSETGVYHIMLRGNNRQHIFEDEEDHWKWVETVQHYKEMSGYEIFAYCLMGNHIHLLLKVGEEPLEQIMRRICGRFVYWYNAKYNRIGNIFQDRYKSEPVEDDAYFLTVMRYIHQNPLKAGLVNNIEQYKWSSYNDYYAKAGWIDTDYVLNLFSSGDRAEARKRFGEFHKAIKEEKCLDIEEKRKITDEAAKEIIKEAFHLTSTKDFKELASPLRKECIKVLREEHGLSIRQIERITGLNRGIILKAK